MCTAASLDHYSISKQGHWHMHMCMHAQTQTPTHVCTDLDTHTHAYHHAFCPKVFGHEEQPENVLQRRRPTATGLPEVVAPLSDTVGLIHTHQGQGHQGGEGFQQHGAVQALWGHIQHPQPACLHHLHMCCFVPSAWQLSCGTETP